MTFLTSPESCERPTVAEMLACKLLFGTSEINILCYIPAYPSLDCLFWNIYSPTIAQTNDIKLKTCTGVTPLSSFELLRQKKIYGNRDSYTLKAFSL